MKLKEKVLEIFENKVGSKISGEEIAKLLGVSRNSVWKAINSLKEDGYEIISCNNSGYIFSSQNEIFTSNSIKRLCETDVDVVILEEADSSNNVAKELAQKGCKEGTVVIVKRQTNGKGRMGRSFISNEENGLYMSIALRPSIPASNSVLITVIGAVATLEAIEKTSHKECQIKWVNDIYINDKKACGILSEAAFNFESGLLDYAIIGIGVNITPPKNGFNEEIKNIATSIFEKAPKNYKSILCAEIIDRFFFHYKDIEQKKYIKLYKEKSNLINKRVDVYRGKDIINGVVIDIDDDANLVLRTEDGEQRFNSGEARVRKNENQ